MKGVFEAYACSEKLAPLVREIGWNHNLIILEPGADSLEREFYLRMTGKFGCSKSVFIRQIEDRGETNGGLQDMGSSWLENPSRSF